MSQIPVIAPIVEGHGEMHAVPVLLHRVFSKHIPEVEVRVNSPIRVKSGSFLKFSADGFERYVRLAANKIKVSGGFVLILLDCEDACPAHLGPHVLAKAQAVRPDVSIIVVLAQREYESWFIAAAQSLWDCRDVSKPMVCPANPMGIRGAKEWLQQHMSQKYDEIEHQLSFTRVFDLEQARQNNPSFNRLIVKLEGWAMGWVAESL